MWRLARPFKHHEVTHQLGGVIDLGSCRRWLHSVGPLTTTASPPSQPSQPQSQPKSQPKPHQHQPQTIQPTTQTKKLKPTYHCTFCNKDGHSLSHCREKPNPYRGGKVTRPTGFGVANAPAATSTTDLTKGDGRSNPKQHPNQPNQTTNKQTTDGPSANRTHASTNADGSNFSESTSNNNQPNPSPTNIQADGERPPQTSGGSVLTKIATKQPQRRTSQSQKQRTPLVQEPSRSASAAPTAAASSQPEPATPSSTVRPEQTKPPAEVSSASPSQTAAATAAAAIPSPSSATATSSSTLSSTTPAAAIASIVRGPTAAQLSPVWSWGVGYLAGLGHGDYVGRSAPTPISILAGVEITDIASSWGHNIACTAGGSVIHWGWKPVMRSWLSVMKYHRRLPRVLEFVQKLDLGRFTLNGAEPLIPTRLLGWGVEPGDPPVEEGVEPLQAVSVSAGSDWCAVLSSEGQVYTFGSGYYGQLGHSSIIGDTLFAYPRMVNRYQNHHPNESHGRKIESIPNLPLSFPNSPIIQVSCGFSHMLILTKNGQVYACGKSDTGALGITHIYRDGKRVFYPHLIPVTDPYAAGEHGSGEQWIKVTAIEAEDAQSSQFAAAQNDPAIVEHYVGPMVQVCAGMKHSLFLNASGEVYACGTNGLNELGNGTYHPAHGLIRVKLPLAPPAQTRAQQNRWRRRQQTSSGASDTTPLDAEADSNEAFFSSAALTSEKIIKIATGMHHCLALSNLGRVYAWGSNLQGQCGHPCKVKVTNQWSGGLVQRKAWGEKSSKVLSEEDQAEGNTTATSFAPSAASSSTSLKQAVNQPRKEAIEEQCLAPTRIRLEQFDLGMPHSQIGRIIDIQAGFYDSVLHTDSGHCIIFGGGNSSKTQFPPHVLKLNQITPTPSPTQPVKTSFFSSSTPRTSYPEYESAYQQPYRLRKLAFGLGHTLALVEEKKEMNKKTR